MTDVAGLTAEEIKAFESFYDERIREARATDHSSELAAARDLLRAVINEGLTPLGDGSISYVRRGNTDWADPVTTAAAQKAMAGKNGRTGKGAGSEMWQGIGLMLAGLVLMLGYWFWPTGTAPEISEAEEAALVITATATIDLSAPPTPLPTLEGEMLADIVDSSGVRTGLVVPRTLEIGGVSFVVQPVKIASGDWQLPDDERAASWVYGTVINYVMGIAASEANKALLNGLKPGAELLLRTSTGQIYRFSLADLVWVSPQASEVFRQTRPGLTLVLLEDLEQERRMAVRANYVPGSELGLAAEQIEVKAALGELVTLDSMVRVTALDNRLLLLPGHVYQAVDYQVRNHP